MLMCHGDELAAALSDDAPDELRVRVRQSELISDFCRMALSDVSFDALLDAASRIAADGLDAPLAKVLQYKPGEDTLLVRAGVGWRPGVVGKARLGADLASPAGYALKTGAPVIASANPGCTVQLEAGIRASGRQLEVVHPVTLLARAYRAAGVI